MLCSADSDVTVVITCCGRFDLLEETLRSFAEFNTYLVRRIILIEDSGSDQIHTVISEDDREHFTVVINEENLGQIRSIDRAYALVDTDYIFHCEEDWLFYRTRFIEDSKSILEADSRVYQVWLRSFHHDIRRDYPFHTLGDDVSARGVRAHRLLSSDPRWQGFSFNPGLRRRSDYEAIPGGYGSLLREGDRASVAESAMSEHMTDRHMFAAVLENDAVAHIGYERRIEGEEEARKIRRKRRRRRKRNARSAALALLAFLLGWLSAGLLH